MRRKLHGLTPPGIFRALTSTAYDGHQLHPAFPVLGAQLGWYCPHTDKHSRRHCGAGEEVKYIAPLFYALRSRRFYDCAAARPNENAFSFISRSFALGPVNVSAIA